MTYFPEPRTYGIGGLVTDGRHDSNEHMLLDGKRPRVDRDTKDLPVGNKPRPQAKNGERDKLSDDLQLIENNIEIYVRMY